MSIEHWYGHAGLLVNGKAVATTHDVDEIQHLVLLGHIPMLLHPRPRRVLVVGLGLGLTYEAVRLHKPEDIVVVEIEPAVAEAAAYLGVRPEHLVVSDARTFLRAGNRRYDVITSDPIHPWVQGGGDLFSHEYFQSCRARLAPGGVACQWLPLYQLSLASVRSILRTFVSVFETRVFFAGTNLVLVGTRVGDARDPRKAPAAVDAALRPLGLAHIADLLCMGPVESASACRGAEILRDDTLRLEFRAPRALESPELPEILAWLRGAWSRPPAPFGSLLRAMEAWTRSDKHEYAEALQQARIEAPGHRFVEQYMAGAYLRHAYLLLDRGEFDGCERYLGYARTLTPDDLRIVGTEGDLREHQGRYEEAETIFARLLARRPGSAWLRRRVKRIRDAATRQSARRGQ